MSQADPDCPHLWSFICFASEPGSSRMSPVKYLSAEDAGDLDSCPLSGLPELSVVPSRESPALAPGWKTLRTDGVPGSATAQLQQATSEHMQTTHFSKAYSLRSFGVDLPWKNP